MRPTVLLTVALVLAGFPPATVRAQTPPTMDAVAFLAGCWQQGAGDGLREHYAPAATNMMTGLSQFWSNGRIVDWEFHRIDAGPDGPVLTPHPRGVASVPFAPADVSENRIVWQNLEHDFPQRIIYTRTGDTLVARIEGGEGADARAREWPMIRTACAS